MGSGIGVRVGSAVGVDVGIVGVEVSLGARVFVVTRAESGWS